MHALPLTEDGIRDIPPRTWRQWGRELPGYSRIALRVVVIASLLHLALAVRITIGLIESPEIRHLHQMNVEISYHPYFDGLPRWFPLYRFMPAYRILNEGFQGRSCCNVSAVTARGDLTDADVEFISRHCPNLESFEAANVSATNFKCLERCTKLWSLDIQRCDVEDLGFPDLSCHPQIAHLSLCCTLVGDSILSELERSSAKLSFINVVCTDVTHEGIRNSSKIGPYSGPPPSTDYCIGSIRWADGRRSAGFPGPSVVVMKYGELTFDTRSLARMDRGAMYWCEENWTHGDGEYQLSIKLADYESAPVTVTVKDNRPNARKIEFLMPATKAEALRSIGR